MGKKDILLIKNLASFEKLINRDDHRYDIDLMVMPGTLEDKHRNVVVREIFGRPPSKMIGEMLLLEAKVLLGSTDKTVTEIAHELHFEDQSHFSHFIRRHTGLTPVSLRKKL